MSHTTSIFIGASVQNLKSHHIGTIISITDGLATVDYGHYSAKYSFPSAFAVYFAFEDPYLEKMIHEWGSDAAFEDFKKRYMLAVEREKNYLKSSGGKKYRVIDGACVSISGESYVYAFDTDTELHFPDGTLLRLHLSEGNLAFANVISSEDFTLMFRTRENLGQNVDVLEFSAEPWQLLEALHERLSDMNPQKNSIAYDLACKGKLQINYISNMALSQEVAIKHAVNEPITFIWGPPGTGKTETLAKIAGIYMDAGKRVLMLSYSNVSVDGALDRTAGKVQMPEGTIVRYGFPRMEKLMNSTLSSYRYVLDKHPQLKEEYDCLLSRKKRCKDRKSQEWKDISEGLSQIRLRIKEEEKDLVQHAAFVATTVSRAVVDSAIYTQMFDAVLFDEASMAYVPQVVFAGGLAKEAFVCLGDFRQLPAIVQDKGNEELRRDIFSYVCGICDCHRFHTLTG